MRKLVGARPIAACRRAESGKSWQRGISRPGARPGPAGMGYDRAVKKHIAIVEDEPALRDNYAAALARHGYQVKTYGNRKPAMQASPRACRTSPSSTFRWRTRPRAASTCAASLRALSAELPIIFLTARDSELDAVSGLRLGADDFLTKDVSLPHLAARVAALFRRIDALRRPQNAADDVAARGAARSTARRMQTTWNGAPVTLSLTEFWIVHALARNPGHVKNRQQLMDAANVVLDDSTITSHVKRRAAQVPGDRQPSSTPSKPCTAWAIAGSSEHSFPTADRRAHHSRCCRGPAANMRASSRRPARLAGKCARGERRHDRPRPRRPSLQRVFRESRGQRTHAEDQGDLYVVIRCGAPPLLDGYREDWGRPREPQPLPSPPGTLRASRRASPTATCSSTSRSTTRISFRSRRIPIP